METDDFIKAELERIRQQQLKADEIKKQVNQLKIEDARKNDKGCHKKEEDYFERVRAFIENKNKKRKTEFVEGKNINRETFRELLDMSKEN